ncbi:unnamed protein product [Owenia fusiformis]|uniref:DUF4440 domain-containing protein n=1 Tax=Owenia fusiformis TaxID=6347 RepID=A0A8J1U4A0_OWEFU|nr:unnamed protein product [Owenia fusiformis]
MGDIKALEEIAQANHDEFDRRWNIPGRDWDKFVEDMYSTDCKAFPPGYPPAFTRQAIAAVFKTFHERHQLHSKVHEVVKIGEDSFLATYFIKCTIDGKQVDQLTTVEVWRKENGQWRLHRDSWNSDFPPPTTSDNKS